MRYFDLSMSIAAFGLTLFSLSTLDVSIDRWQWWLIVLTMLVYSMWQFADGVRKGISIGRRKP